MQGVFISPNYTTSCVSISFNIQIKLYKSFHCLWRIGFFPRFKTVGIPQHVVHSSTFEKNKKHYTNMCACCGHISPAPCSSAANAWKISSRRRRIKPGMRRWGACRQRSTAGRNSSSPIKCPLNPRWFWRIAANLLLFKNNVFSLHPIGSYCHLLELARWTCFF